MGFVAVAHTHWGNRSPDQCTGLWQKIKLSTANEHSSGQGKRATKGCTNKSLSKCTRPTSDHALYYCVAEIEILKVSILYSR